LRPAALAARLGGQDIIKPAKPLILSGIFRVQRRLSFQKLHSQAITVIARIVLAS
jgi:hypothetical protein